MADSKKQPVQRKGTPVNVPVVAAPAVDWTGVKNAGLITPQQCEIITRYMSLSQKPAEQVEIWSSVWLFFST